MVGVADVASQRHPQQLAAEVVLQAGADDLLAVIKVFGADEADDGVGQQRLERARDAIGAGLAGLLVHAVVGAGGKRAALAGLEVHDVVAQGPAPKRQRSRAGLGEQGQVDAEAAIGLLGASDRLEDQVHRRSLRDHRQRVGDVGEHAGLGRDLQPRDHVVEHAHQAGQRRDAVTCRIDADHRIARAIEQAIDDRGGNAAQVVGRMVGLQAHGEMAGQADRVAKAGDDAALARDQDEVLVAHQLADRRRHLRRDAGAHRCEACLVGGIRQQPVAKRPHVQVRDRGERRGVVAVDDQSRDLVGLVRDQRFVQEASQGHLGQAHPRRHPLHTGVGGNARQPVPGAWRRGLGHHVLQVAELPAAAIDGVTVAVRGFAFHGPSTLTGRGSVASSTSPARGPA